jgi:Obg family GTPase CgtA-like protein
MQNKDLEVVDNPEVKLYDLKNREDDDPRNYTIVDQGDLRFVVSGKRLEQIVRMTDFDNKEAIMRVYDILEKIGAIRKIQKQVNKFYDENEVTNDFYFE